MVKISQKNDPIKQHYVPKVYLKNFCNSNNAIAVVDRHTRKIFSTGIGAVGAEKDFYTLEKMEDPYCWERTYATGVEPLMGNLLPTIISRTNLLVQSGSCILSTSEKEQLAIIMVMQLVRGKQIRKYERMLYQDYLPIALAKVNVLFGPLNDTQKALVKSFTTDDYYFKRTSMDIALDAGQIIRYAEILNGRNFIFYRIQGDMEFITSDNPVMFINNRTGDARPLANGLRYTSTDVYYPISPKLLLCTIHSGAFFGALSNSDCCLIDLDIRREAKFISTINRKQIEQCSRHAFARSKMWLV